MTRAVILAAAATSLLANAAPAPAQPTGRPRSRVSVNSGIQVIGATSSQAFSLKRNLEPAPVTASAALKNARLFDAGATIRVAKGFGVGGAVSWTASRNSAEIVARVPHPFFFNQPRTVTGTASVTRTELATHVDAAWVASTSRVDVALSAGPTLLRLTQNLITDAAYSDSYPYDTATFVSATTVRKTKSAVGYNVGADVTWKLSRIVGIGGLVRFTRATITLTADEGNVTRVNAGGLQLSGGIRFLF